jgi:hypothetical protein
MGQVVEQDQARITWTGAMLEAERGQVGRRLLEAQPELAHVDAQGNAHEDSVERAVANDQDGPLRQPGIGVEAVVGPQLVGKERRHPSGDIVAGLTARARKRGRIDLPGETLIAIALVNLGVGQALPVAVVHLTQTGIGLNGRGLGAASGDDRGGLAGPDQRTAQDPLEADLVQAHREGHGLGLSGRRELDIDPLAQMLLGIRPGGQSVASQDQREHGWSLRDARIAPEVARLDD